MHDYFFQNTVYGIKYITIDILNMSKQRTFINIFNFVDCFIQLIVKNIINMFKYYMPHSTLRNNFPNIFKPDTNHGKVHDS